MVEADGSLRDIKELRLLTGHAARVTSVAFHPDGRTAASCSADGTIRFWDVETGKELRRLSVHLPSNPAFADIAFSPEGRHLLACYSNNTIHVYRVEMHAN